jgi:hypothetical protein
MAKYIKSHSNYVLAEKLQDVKQGTIYERDISTTGGSDRFGKRYSDGGFVFTNRKTIPGYRNILKKGWVQNEEGDIWNQEILTGQESDVEGSVESRISIKNHWLKQ